MRNNCDNQIYRNHSFSKLRRKNKQEIQNAKFNLENRNQEINDITKYTCKPKNKTIENDNRLHSKYNNIYSKFKQKILQNRHTAHNKVHNNINNFQEESQKINNINNINNYNDNIPQKNAIIRQSKSAFFHNKKEHNHSEDNNDNDYYLCQNCINEHLIEEKRRQREEEYNKRNVPAVFEDKNKYYTEKIIRDKLDKREKNINEAYRTLVKCQRSNMKEKLIRQNENAQNPLNNFNHNYLYENFRKKYAQKQQYMQDNYNKYVNNERPEITKYFNNYINNPNYKAKEFGEYKPKIIDVEDYKKDLSEQINYKINKKRREREEDKINEDKEYLAEMKKIEKENRENALKKQKLKEELIKGNLDIIRAKKENREKLLKEDLKYKEYYMQENIEYKNDLLNEQYKKNKINREFVSENQKNLNRIRRKKEQNKLEKDNYRYVDYSYDPPKEAMDECYKCHKIYPRKLLTKNSTIFGYKKKIN